MASVARVSKAARILSFTTLIFMIGMILSVAYFFIDVDIGRDYMLGAAQTSYSPATIETLSNGTLRLMMAVGWMAVAVQLFILWRVKTLFDLYGAGEFLSLDCALTIRSIGIGLLALPIVRFIQQPLWSMLKTMREEETMITISISSNGLGFAIGGALMMLIGWAMVEASRAAEENRGFV